MRYLGRTLLRNTVFALMLIFAMTAALESFAQSLEFTLNPRRRFDQIHVEFWVKGLPQGQAEIPKIGFASLIIKYNNAFLQPIAEANQATIRNLTDSIHFNVDQNPVIAISSQFHSANGYDALGSQGYGVGIGEAYYSLEVALSQIGNGGVSPATTGRGSFIGRISFQILAGGNPDITSLTNIGWGDAAPGGIILKDANNNNIKAQAVFTEPGSFNVLGVTLLSPIFNGQVVDRDKNYAALSGAYAPAVGQPANGYPIYFERSINPSNYVAPIDENIGYKFEYSLDSGSTWIEFARIAETNQTATAVGTNPQYVSGAIFPTTGAAIYPITTQSQAQLGASNYRDPLRIIWRADQLFTQRSEAAKIRVTQLAKKNNNSLSARADENLRSQTNGFLILGRLFFVQLNGNEQYLRTPGNFSNSTQLTVEAWVNLDNNQPSTEGIETGIVASSGGPGASTVNGSNEGTWMLYLKDGRYPAFRVRDILGRGTNGYLATLLAHDPINTFSSDKPLPDAHAGNWVHIAATVNKNEVTLYVDGEIVDKEVNNTVQDMRMNVTSHPIWIGVNPNNTLHDYLNAGIKGVRVWRNALTQDEIRQRAAGIADPAAAVTPFTATDLRKGLQFFYRLEGDINDAASEATFQEGAENALFYVSETLQTSSPEYRPDKPHIKVTSPVANSGVKNKSGDLFELRWISYGLGTLNNSADDIEFQYSLDAGSSWSTAVGSTGAPLNNINIELSKINWEPFRSSNLITYGAKNVILRARGLTSNQQDDIRFTTGSFKIAPFFALKKDFGSIIVIPGNNGMNIAGSTMALEAWIRHERYPTVEEGAFPIIVKMDSVSGVTHYSLSLLPTGQLEFEVTDASGVIRTAVSDASMPVVQPNSYTSEEIWTHIAVYAFFNPTGSSEVKFYIDGTPQTATAQLGNNITLDAGNRFNTYIGYAPSHTRPLQAGQEEPLQRTARGFIGLLREVRFWNGTPNDASAGGNEPTALTRFIQGAQAVRAENLTANTYNKNLFMSFSMNSGEFVYLGYHRAIPTTYPTQSASAQSPIVAHYYGVPISFEPTLPYVKLVEPVFKQPVKRTKTDVRIRWVGFDYDGLNFSPGAVGTPPALEFSTEGGGGVGEFYKYIAGPYFAGQTAAFYFPAPITDSYRFDGTSSQLYYAALINASIADPDINNNNTNVQGAIAPSLTNARLRLSAKYNINAQGIRTIRSESPLFTITPGSNFTTRMLLEGYHRGTTQNITNIGSTFDDGGIRITLYQDNSGAVGNAVAQGVSTDMYASLVTSTRGAATSQFANVYFVFDSIPDGNYWVKVEHLNHLSVMSRYPAPFKFSGDNLTTWQVESGWDFQSWGGNPLNIVQQGTANPWTNRDYTAKGNVVDPADKSNPNYSAMGLAYNDGALSTSLNPMPALVAGDVVRDGVINAEDRAQVRLDDGTHLKRSDVNGDGDVNASDRTIVDRNFGKVSSIYSFEYPSSGKAFFEQESGNNQQGNSIAKAKALEAIQSSVNYSVSADVEFSGKYVDVHVFIKNNGADFNLANATFAIKYNSNALKYLTLTGQSSVPYHNSPTRGYSQMRSAPRPDAESPVPNVRTIEIDYDAFANLGGLPVPSEKTYLGTLRFEIISDESTVAFSWYKSSVVYSASGGDITSMGNFERIGGGILYTAAITAPKLNETLLPDKYYNVSWTSTGNADVYVEYTTNAGNSWQKINTEPVALVNNAITWRTPDVFSSACFVRLVEATSGEEFARSQIFTIKPVNFFAQILRPSSGDRVYSAGNNEPIVWNIEGYDKIRLEFSPDYGNTWQGIASGVEAGKTTINWKIPTVTTKSAFVRMLDEATGNEIARSSVFKILSGSLEFRTPKQGERLRANADTRIRWTPQNVTSFDIDISYDGGASWSVLQQNVKASETFMNWRVPNTISDRVMLRAIWFGDSEMEYARTGAFSIEAAPSSVEILPEGWEIGNISPNPSNEFASLQVVCPSEEFININIYDASGAVVMTFGEIKLTAGNNPLRFNLGELSAGAYYMTINTKHLSIARTLRIIK